MPDKYGVEHDLYCYPDSPVLINFLNIRNEALLEEAETEFSLVRASEYQPSFEVFDLNHLIHWMLFFVLIFNKEFLNHQINNA